MVRLGPAGWLYKDWEGIVYPSEKPKGFDPLRYIADFFDVRTAHPDPDAEWDRSNGRIYKLMREGAKPAPKIDLYKLSSAELVALLNNPNGWYADQARLLLASRRDPSVYPDLRRTALATSAPAPKRR